MTEMKNFVVLDDSREDRFFVRRKLLQKFKNSNVQEFVYAHEALSWLAENKAAHNTIWLVDINLPGVSGFEFLEAAQVMKPNLAEDNLFFVMSNSIDPEDKLRTDDQAIASSFISKPLDVEELARLIA